MVGRRFVEAVSSLSFPHAFNPYADRCPVHDKPSAAKTRAKILRRLLAAAERQGVDSLWIGRDLGWRGGRRTGLAFTDDAHFAAHLARFGLGAARPTRGAPLAERTASVLWEALARIEGTVFLWNVFPLHPHPPGEPFGNRKHDARERAAGEEILRELIQMLRPRRIVAIGSDAAASASRVAPEAALFPLRHPSFGGEARFRSEIAALYDLPLNSG